MKTLRKLQVAATSIGVVYGFWLGANVEATAQDVKSAWVIVAMSLVMAITLSVSKEKDVNNNI